MVYIYDCPECGSLKISSEREDYICKECGFAFIDKDIVIVEAIEE